MARTPRKPSSKSVKAAADRAEKRSKGEEPKHEATPLEPGVVTEGSAVAGPGRPTEYKPEYCDSARKLASGGATIAEIAAEFGVSRMTVHRWMAAHQDFRDSIKLASAEADERVELSLYERATGYEYDATKIFCSEGMITTHDYKEHVPADLKAIHMWLLNRRPKDWKNVQKIEHTGPGGGPVEVSISGDIAKARRVAFALGQAAMQLARAKAADAEVVDDG